MIMIMCAIINYYARSQADMVVPGSWMQHVIAIILNDLFLFEQIHGQEIEDKGPS
jgi:hypothetical protein